MQVRLTTLLTIAPFFVATILPLFLSPQSNAEIIRQVNHGQVTEAPPHVNKSDSSNRNIGPKHGKQLDKKSKKRGRRRHKSKKRRPKRARLLRSEAQPFAYNARRLGTRTMGLQWVIDIKQNLTTLMRGLEQVERQLSVVKQELKKKSSVSPSTDMGMKTPAPQQAPASSTICPWEMLNGEKFNKCYSFHKNDRRSWYQAAASCRVVGGRLLRIGSAEETAFLLSRAPAWMSSGSAWLTTTWTDGNRLYPCPRDGNSIWPSEKSWGWGTRVDRICFDELMGDPTHPLKVYTDWLMSASPHEGACVALAVASTNWEALDCDRPAAYICERSPIKQDGNSNNGRPSISRSSGKITAEQPAGLQTSDVEASRQYEPGYDYDYDSKGLQLSPEGA